MRRPGGAARDRGALRGGIEAAVQAVEVDVGRQRVEPLGGPLDLGDAGQEGEQAALALGQRAADRRRHLVLDPLLGGAAEMDRARSDGARPSLSITGASPISVGEARAVERRRHGEQPQIGPQRRLRVERQREAEIAVEAALVHLVEQHGRDAGQLGIGLDALAGRCPR